MVRYGLELEASERQICAGRGDTASPLSAPTVNQLTIGAEIQTFCDGHHNLIEQQLRRGLQALTRRVHLVASADQDVQGRAALMHRRHGKL